MIKPIRSQNDVPYNAIYSIAEFIFKFITTHEQSKI